MKRLALLLLLLAAPAEPAQYWVRPNGSNLKQGAFDGSDWTAQHALSVQWFNENAVAGDTCRIFQGSYGTPIQPRNAGTDAARITYLGQIGSPHLAIFPAILLDSSATHNADYITVSNITTTGEAKWSGGYYHARWDSIVGCVIKGGGNVTGGYNFLKSSSFGDGTTGDAFTFAYAGGTGADYYKSFAAKNNKAEDCTFNLRITGVTNPALQWRCQDSLQIIRSRHHLRIGTGGSDLHLWTIYGMQNSLIQDSYFDGQTLTAQTAHIPSTRDVYLNNVFSRDTIVEVPGGAATTNVDLMTSGAVTIPGEYNANNTYSDMRVRVGGPILYEGQVPRDKHVGGVYISGEKIQLANCQAGCSSPADSMTITHNTFITFGTKALEQHRITNSRITQNIFARYGANGCGGIVGYFTDNPGTVDSNMVWSRVPTDSLRAIDWGHHSGCDYKSLGGWCAATGKDARSIFASPMLLDTLSWQTITYVPDSLSQAYGAWWADGYAGAINAYADVAEPMVELTGPCPYTPDPLPETGSVSICWTATDNRAVTAMSLYYSKSTTPTTWVLIASGLAASGTYLWNYPLIYESRVNVRGVATDAAGNTGQDIIVLTKQCGSPCEDEHEGYREPFEP